MPKSSTLTTAYSYDSVGNLLTQASSGASDIAFSYSYNKNGYITGEVRTENGQTTESSYAYDALGQLTSFLQSTGYGEQYAYDKAGNMTEKVITPLHSESEEAQAVTLKMSYNKGNQLTAMANGKDKITYSYDKNGSMVQKVLSSQTYGKLTDTYAYNALDQLTSYTGYDGYTQQFTYDANGMRLSEKETGDASRSTLEELLRGNIAGLPEIVAPQAQASAADVPEELAWATTDYLYDVTQEYYQVITETRTETDGHTATTAYAYGLERIATYTADGKTSYVYDGRGSVVQAVTAPVAGERVSSVLPDVAVKVQSFSYSAFGEQMGAQKVSGFTYNAEAFDAATGMLNLRARQYEPTMNRFSQKDIVRGQTISPLSLSRYAYCGNSPIMYIDPSGEYMLDSIGNWWDKTQHTTIGKVIDTLIVKPVDSIAKRISSTLNPIIQVASAAVEKASQIYLAAKQEIASIDSSRPTCEIEKKLIWERACSNFIGDDDSVNTITQQLEKIQSYDKHDWLFLTGDFLMDEDVSLSDRFAMLDILKEKQEITAEDLIALGLYTEENRYHPFFLGLLKEDVAGNYAALLELSYRLTRTDTTLWEMSLQEQQMRAQQQFALLYYLGIQAGLTSIQAYNAAGSAIRMEGATNATPGYESVPSDFLPFDYSGTKYYIDIPNPVTADSIVFSDKFLQPAYKRQLRKRGWTNEKIADAINYPVKTEASKNKYTGNSVTLYFVDDIHYVAVDNGTGKVIQVADPSRSNWRFDNYKAN